MSDALLKIPSGIPGFDRISFGGIPKKKTTLLAGTSGSGKTVFVAQFLYKGIVENNENGVFVTFEETPNEIINNLSGFNWDIKNLISKKKWSFVDFSPSPTEEFESGAYDLGAMLYRLEYAIKKIKAKRVVLDSISSLFTRYQDASMVRRELYRISRKLKDIGVTSIITAERPTEGNEIARYGVEEFVTDNVILLHNRLSPLGRRDRTIDILKFRGTSHETSESPIIVNETGLHVFPRPNPELTGKGYRTRIKTGIPVMDKMLNGGVYKNSTTLLSGPSGTGKTVSGMHFILEGARNGEKCLFIEFEESPEQLFRNARSFGWELEKYVKNGVVQLISHYPEDLKAEQYLGVIQRLVLTFKAKRVVLDSLSALERIYSKEKFREFVIGLNAFLKMNNCTSLLTNTTSELTAINQITETHLSTATDNIILMKYVDINGKMKRILTILKQRGSGHDKHLTEYEITKAGLRLIGPLTGYEGLIGGAASFTFFDRDKEQKKILRRYIENKSP